MKAPRILVVDDDYAMLYMLQEYLELLGFQIFAYNSAYDAVQDIEAKVISDIQLVISDVNMSQMDGLEFLAWVKSTLNSPVILISSFGTKEIHDLALKSGASLFLNKPFSLLDLKSAIERHLAASA